jgi:hypothetical protein
MFIGEYDLNMGATGRWSKEFTEDTQQIAMESLEISSPNGTSLPDSVESQASRSEERYLLTTIVLTNTITK